jgi:hypothetical protein
MKSSLSGRVDSKIFGDGKVDVAGENRIDATGKGRGEIFRAENERSSRIPTYSRKRIARLAIRLWYRARKTNGTNPSSVTQYDSPVFYRDINGSSRDLSA